jgi:hypothetical protein
MKVAPDVLAVLSGCGIMGNQVTIHGQLDRSLYKKVNDVLEALGGKWNRKAKAHVFQTDPYEALDNVIVNGHVDHPKDDDFFPTPLDVVSAMLNRSDLPRGPFLALEPSAGEGAIADELKKAGAEVVCVEKNPARCEMLRKKGHRTVEGDFLSCPPTAIPLVDRIVMNPPFSRSMDVKHVTHALRFLTPHGRLVSVMSAGVRFRRERLYLEFREMVDSRGGVLFDLPPDSFKASGTGVNTILAVI